MDTVIHNMNQSPHSFHIPVMGTGFTMDTPLKVARYGITSVVSISDDRLLEKMREYHAVSAGEEYVPIEHREEDARARRITSYLNLLDRLVKRQIQAVKEAPFQPGSEITKYFEMLDDSREEKQMYLEMLKTPSPEMREGLERLLREKVVPGAIDVNVMSKVDRDNTKGGKVLPAEYSDALSALRGYAQSELSGSQVVLSAGYNPRLYGYIPQFQDFYPDEEGRMRKRIALKVSDFRSAFIQGKLLAKKALWVSEYRIESGLNCGGHAFPTQGHLLGPVLEEFNQKREELKDAMWALYQEALRRTGRDLKEAPPIVFSAQGGVGSDEEHRFLKRYYRLNSVGWGTPFLLVPEATNVDEKTLKLLAEAREEDIELSRSSPLGVPFYTLRTSASEAMRQTRIREGHPGSPCLYGHLAYNTEFGIPLCTASRTYQKKKIDQLRASGMPALEFRETVAKVVEKACICHDLGAGTQLKYHLRPTQSSIPLTPAVCPGPNLAFFSKVASLSEMVGHIYGKIDLVGRALHRPHVFIKELALYADHFKRLIKESAVSVDAKMAQFLADFKKNLADGIRYYRGLAGHIAEMSEKAREQFVKQLTQIESDLERLTLPSLLS